MKIYSFDTRDNYSWNVIKDYFSLDNKQMHNEIKTDFNDLKTVLKKSKINYDDLRSILTPSQDKKEICFIYDSLKTKNSAYYGYEILQGLLPELMISEKISISYGDIITNDGESNTRIRTFLQKEFPKKDFCNYQLSNQYFVVYGNNLSKNDLYRINAAQEKCPSYVGYIDMTYSNYLKDILSVCIGVRFIKIKDKICVPTPEDDLNNPQGYVCCSFDENKYFLVGIDELLFSSFLSYKIQRSFVRLDETDQLFGLNAVYENPDILSGYTITLTDEKFKYIREEKNGVIKITGLEALSKDKFIKMIQFLINTNYIFDIDFNEQFNCLKFATVIEVVNKGIQRKYKAVFEVMKEKKELRIITFY